MVGQYTDKTRLDNNKIVKYFSMVDKECQTNEFMFELTITQNNEFYQETYLKYL